MLNLYNQLSVKVFAEQSTRLYQEGYTQYSRGKYKEALKAFETSLKMNPENVDSMYFTARSYDRSGDKTKAIEWYNKIVEKHGDTQRAVEAKRMLTLLGE